jgi:hypothetical protein
MNSTTVFDSIVGGSRMILIGSKFCGYSIAEINDFIILVVETNLSVVKNHMALQNKVWLP